MKGDFKTSSRSLRKGEKAVIEAARIQDLFDALAEDGYRIVGPTVRNSAVVYDELASAVDLPRGWVDEQEAGSYRLRRLRDEAMFGYGVGQHSWKDLLLPPTLRLWQARRGESGIQFIAEDEEICRRAFIGVRACDLHAIRIQDRIFLHGATEDRQSIQAGMEKYSPDPRYKSRRENIFVVAVQCTRAGGTCFCASMGTGPKATFGFDLALTEVPTNGQPCFVVEVGTETGGEVLRRTPHRTATDEEVKAAESAIFQTAAQMGRSMDTTDIKDLLYHNSEHPRWQHVAARCLTCGNCTMVCPTCFCTTIEDTADLTGSRAQRLRKWSSCFTLDFSYIHGGSVRSSSMSRYRQWLTHKLAAWIDQFGMSGCVGCGRCITWCPAAIDITEEVRAIRGAKGAATLSAKEKCNVDL